MAWVQEFVAHLAVGTFILAVFVAITTFFTTTHAVFVAPTFITEIPTGTNMMDCNVANNAVYALLFAPSMFFLSAVTIHASFALHAITIITGVIADMHSNVIHFIFDKHLFHLFTSVALETIGTSFSAFIPLFIRTFLTLKTRLAMFFTPSKVTFLKTVSMFHMTI